MSNPKNPLLSVIITAHSEGILIHRTLRSVKRSIELFNEESAVEIILHVDNPTPETIDYIKTNEDGILRGVQIIRNSFGDLGSSRNFAIQEAHGEYIATIDADDIMSKNWLKHAVDTLQAAPEPTIAHSAYTLEFEGTDSLIIKHGEIDYDTDTLLSVFANRWNSVIVAPRELMLQNPYTPNSPGFGYEDWHLNSRMIFNRVHNILIPETAIFVRRKRMNSEWQRQINSTAVLRASPLLSFENIRSITNPFLDSKQPKTDQLTRRSLLRRAISRYPIVKRAAVTLRDAVTAEKLAVPTGKPRVPRWLEHEWKDLHQIDRQIFPHPHLLRNIPTYDTITPDHILAGSLYKQLVDTLSRDRYDYILFAPWLVKGGADKYTIDYANTIASLAMDYNVLVVATLPTRSVWANKLSDTVDFLDFGTITKDASQSIKHRLLEQLVENAGAKVLHVINSELGYDFIAAHRTYLHATGKKIVVTSFSQSVAPDSHLYGYSHTHVPVIYEQANIVTSDNQAVIDMWINEYGFDPQKLLLHRQQIAQDDTRAQKADYSQESPLRILWTARVAPEKQPELLKEIGELVSDIATIDIYGTITEDSKKSLTNLPTSVRYYGGFSDFYALDPTSYDALLYTSLFDGMPNTLLEAAQVGLPIIASAVGGIPEFIEDKKTGLLVTDITNPEAYAQAIRFIAENSDRSQSLTVNATAKLHRDFSPESYQENIKHMLQYLGALKKS